MATLPPTTNPAAKKLSCVFCTQRKVRCDKLSPCSNCRKAGIACVATVAKRRRAVHHAGTSSASSEVALETRLRALEGLLENLQNQLESARASPGTSDSASPQSQISSTSTLSQDIGRLVLQGPSDVRGISSGFCSTIAEELSSIKQDAESHITAAEANDEDDDEYEGDSFSSPLESPGHDEQSLLHSGGFIFGHGGATGTAHLQELLPMPSQVPYLLDVYAHRVQIFISIPHMPSLRKSLQDNSPNTGGAAAASQQALLASIYYAAIVSLDEEEVTRSFGSPKPELLRKYRTGFELSLAKADFLSKPDLAIVQALCIYLNVARRYESSRVGWMLIGLAIRIGYYLGLHQDGENSTHLPPFEIEMRRRTWWALLALDLRSSEDQGTALAILPGSFTTKWPSNIDDVDLDPKADTIPRASEKITNVTLHRIMCEVVGTVHEMISGQKNSIEDHGNRLNRLSSLVHQEFFRYHEAKQHSSYMPLTGLIHIVMGRLTIVGYFPIVGANATNAHMNLQLRTKVLVAAIEVTEHNHGLNTDPRCRPWAWVYQCEVYWHAIVYILIDICRRPWTSTIERAWLSLHSPHLIPARAAIEDNFQVFVPLQKLLHRARLHRKRELAKWRADPIAATAAEFEDQMTIPVHDCSGTFPGLSNTEDFRQRWLRLTTPSSSTSPESNVPDERRHMSRQHSNDTTVSEQTHWDIGTSTNPNAQSTLQPPKSLPTVLGLPEDLSNQQDCDNMDFNMDIDWDQWIGAAQGMDWTL